MRSLILVLAAHKYVKRGEKEEVCNEIAKNRFIMLNEKKTTDFIIYLIAKNISLNPAIYSVDSIFHVVFPSANDINLLMSEIPIPLYDEDNNKFIQKIEDDGSSIFLIREEKGIYLLTRLNREQFVKACLGLGGTYRPIHEI